MNEHEARAILHKMKVEIQRNGHLFGSGCDCVFFPGYEEKLDDIQLDGHYSADELEALAWWMRSYKAVITKYEEGQK